MDIYPREYIRHELPLVLLSGLGEQEDQGTAGQTDSRQASGSRIINGSPECFGDRATQLLDQLLIHDGSDVPWDSSTLPRTSGQFKYRLKAIGRVGMKS